MLNFFKTQLQKVYSAVTVKLKSIFSRQYVDEALYVDLECILLEADTGVTTTRQCLDFVRKQAANGAIQTGSDVQKALATHLRSILGESIALPEDASVYLLVGVNGTGKTTFAAKLAYRYKKQHKKVLLVAADTFRAAACAQLAEWASRVGVDIVSGAPQQDPASVVFNACQKYRQDAYDVLIVDTAGRLQTKSNLMKELAKIRLVISKHIPAESVVTLLTIDALLGQNSFEQAKIFNEACPVSGIVLTKMDGTGKGGIVFAIRQELRIPITYISCGEGLENIQPFDADEYIKQLFAEGAEDV